VSELDEDDAIRADMDTRARLEDKQLVKKWNRSRAALYRAYWRSVRREREQKDMQVSETTCLAK
jgi:hypothetical protein